MKTREVAEQEKLLLVERQGIPLCRLPFSQWISETSWEALSCLPLCFPKCVVSILCLYPYDDFDIHLLVQHSCST